MSIFFLIPNLQVPKITLWNQKFKKKFCTSSWILIKIHYMKSHDVIFETRSIWTQNPRDNLKNLEAQPRGFWDCREGFEQNTRGKDLAEEYFVEIERGENDTARVQGATRAGEGRNAPGPSCPLNESGIVLPEFNFNHILRVSKITSCDFVFILWPWIIWSIIKEVKATHCMINHA